MLNATETQHILDTAYSDIRVVALQNLQLLKSTHGKRAGLLDATLVVDYAAACDHVLAALGLGFAACQQAHNQIDMMTKP